MSVVDCDHIDLLQLAARQLTGHQHRLFLAEVTLRVCDGKARQAEEIFGWGRETVRKGLEELRTGTSIVDNFAARGRVRFEDRCLGWPTTFATSSNRRLRPIPN
jgi:hypothetical protein